MEIRKVTNGFAVTGTRIYENEIVIFTDVITIIAENNTADTMVLSSERETKIKENSRHIPIT